MSQSQPPPPRTPPKKSLKERAKELVTEILDLLEDLVPAPEPTLIPVPVQGRRRRR